MTVLQGKNRRSACVIGATGLVGGRLLALLADHADYGPIATVGRRAPAQTGPGITHHLADLGAAAPAPGLSADTLFCCLGTTIQQAGSRAAFRRVDHDMVVNAARQAVAGGANTLVVVSSLGAHSRARSFYQRTKGEMETGVAAVGFRRVGILRPSLLMGERDEHRPVEAVSQTISRWINPLLIGPAARYRSVDASAVAEAMIAVDRMDFHGIRVVESDEIPRLARLRNRVNQPDGTRG